GTAETPLHEAVGASTDTVGTVAVSVPATSWVATSATTSSVTRATSSVSYPVKFTVIVSVPSSVTSTHMYCSTPADPDVGQDPSDQSALPLTVLWDAFCLNGAPLTTGTPPNGFPDPSSAAMQCWSPWMMMT